jgi:hypothetical protein
MLSLATNVLLVALLWWNRPPGSPVNSPQAIRTIRTLVTNAPRTHIISRKEPFHWSQIESPDFETYIKGLREIGCPEQTIRDIIVAEVNQLYASRQAALLPDDVEWWKPNVQQQAAESLARKQRDLDDEKRLTLTTLLGNKWQTGLPSSTNSFMLWTGAVLSQLSEEKRRAVSEVLQRSSERLVERAKGSDNGEITEAMRAQQRQEVRAELAKLLTPEQLEEYLLRWSHNANQLRAQLEAAKMEVTPDEFRALFRTLDPIEQQLSTKNGSDSSVGRATLAALEKQRDDVLRQALGAERYQMLKLQEDPVFVQARDAVERSGAAAEAVLPLYEVNRLTQAELQRIRNDNTLSEEQREAAMAAAWLENARAVRQLVGDEVYETLKRNSPLIMFQ